MKMGIDYRSKITLDSLAAYSPWPARLLGLDPIEQKHKNAKEIMREFGDEKWGALLEMFSGDSNFTIADIEAKEKKLKSVVPSFDNQLGFYLGELGKSDARVMKYMEDTLRPYSEGASCLIELGAGYGAKIFKISDTIEFKGLDLMAFEYTKTGCDLINLVAKHSNKSVAVAQFDFNKLNFDKVHIPENAIIFTSYALHYVKEVRDDFVKFIHKLKPKVVVHFEPCYDYLDANTLHGLLCRRYIEVNGYTQNIGLSIESGCKQVHANIKIQKNVHGTNPFLPFSIIQWAPFGTELAS